MPEATAAPIKPAGAAAPAAAPAKVPSPAASRPASLDRPADRPGPSPFEELDTMLEAADKPTPKPKEKATPEEREDRQDDPYRVVEEAVKPEGEKPAEEEAPAQPEGKGKGDKIKPLRDSYEQSKKRVKELEAEVATLRENKPAGDIGELSTQLEAANKRAEQAETELKFVRYEKSNEYQERYLQPMTRAFQKAYGDVTQLTVTDAEGNERPGTQDDFNALLRMPLGEAIKAAKAFGEMSTEVLAHRRKIIELREEAGRAIEDYRTKGAEREKTQETQTRAQQAAAAKQFHTLNAQAREKYKDWFQPEEGDEAGNLLLKKGYELADKVFGDPGSIPPEERVKMHSAAYNQIAGFGRLALKNKKLSARVKELEAQILEYEQSGPTGGSRRPRTNGAPQVDANGRPVSPGLADANAEIDEMAAGRR